MKIKVAILGAKGRMGTESVKAISAAGDLELVASLDLGDSLDLLKSSGAEVVLDFTTPDSVMKNLEYAITNGIDDAICSKGCHLF
jgi:4-hydroxy-tetrahydrodipicolinate reductase